MMAPRPGRAQAAKLFAKTVLLLGAVVVGGPLWLAWTAVVAASALLVPLVVAILSFGTAAGAIAALVFASWGAWWDAASAGTVAVVSGLLAGSLDMARARTAPGFGAERTSLGPWWWWL